MSFGESQGTAFPSSAIEARGQESGRRWGKASKSKAPKQPKQRLNRFDERHVTHRHENRADVPYGFWGRTTKDILLTRSHETGLATGHPFRNAADYIKYLHYNEVPKGTYESDFSHHEGQRTARKGYETELRIYGKTWLKIGALLAAGAFVGASFFPQSKTKTVVRTVPGPAAAAPAQSGTSVFEGNLTDIKPSLVFNSADGFTYTCKRFGSVAMRPGGTTQGATSMANLAPGISTPDDLATNSTFLKTVDKLAANHEGPYKDHPYTAGDAHLTVVVDCTQQAPAAPATKP